MRVGNREFKIKRIKQYQVAGNLFGTTIECTGDTAPIWVDTFMPITDTGISALEGQMCYLGKFEKANGNVFMRLVLRDIIPFIEKE